MLEPSRELPRGPLRGRASRRRLLGRTDTQEVRKLQQFLPKFQSCLRSDMHVLMFQFKVPVVLRLGEHAEEELVAGRLKTAKRESEGKKTS